MIKKLEPKDFQFNHPSEDEEYTSFGDFEMVAQKINELVDHSNRQDEALIYLAKLNDVGYENLKDYPGIVKIEPIIRKILSTDSNEEMK